MQHSILSGLWFATQGGTSPAIEEPTSSKETRASAALERALTALKEPHQAAELGELASSLAAESEERGFQTGFSLAVRMMAECYSTNRKE